LVKVNKKRKEKQPDFISLTQTIQKMKNIIIASTSTVHGSDYLEYLLPELKSTLDIATRYYLFHTQDLAVFHMKNIQQRRFRQNQHSGKRNT
jgi:hypothetical protein